MLKKRTRLSEFLIPLGILSFLLSMLIPLPAPLLDCLLGASIVFSLFLLLSVLSVHNPLMLSSFPTMLLIATFYRLALNVSTTRLILTGQETSRLIEGLGGLVMQGSVLIGAVVFLIVTLIQFIVIAKGAERVAEVSARFTLDALPGKQMSIDADIRSGLLDLEGARKKRHELQIESRFFGALDGAMKFIKGDAIAGICITLINIVAGVIVGVLVRGYPLGEAVARFTTLTVGDGLLSQIPALLTSLAAAMIVTRVVSKESESASGEMVYQIAQLVIARRILGVLCIGLSFVQNIPLLPFLILGFVLILIPAKSSAENLENSTKIQFEPSLPALVEIRLSQEQFLKLGSSVEVFKLVEDVRRELFETWGILIQAPRMNTTECEDKHCQIFIRGIEYAHSSELLENRQLIDFVSTVLARQKIALMDDGVMRQMLNVVEERSPDLVSQLVPERYSLTDLTALCRALLEERVAVRNLDLILQGAAECEKRGMLLSAARKAVSHMVERNLLTENAELYAWQLAPEVDLLFWDETQSPASSLRLAMDHVIENLLLDESERAVIICSSRTRRSLFELCKARGMHVYVIALDEISEHTDVIIKGILGRIEENEVCSDSFGEELAA